MAIATNAQVSAILGVGMRRATNPSNVGLDRGMLKSYGERQLNSERRRITIGDLSGAKRPFFFINPFGDEGKEKSQKIRPRSLSKLRRLEKRTYWIQDLRNMVNVLIKHIVLRNPLNSYESVIRSKAGYTRYR